MSITYTVNIPFASNNPSTDQPNMEQNTNAINSWVQIDHVGFNASNGGEHKQVTFPAETTQGTPSGTSSTLYTAAGVADNTHPTLQYVNANLTFPVSLVRAYGCFVGSTGAIDASQSIGVASIVRNSAGSYTVTLNANVVSNTTYGVFFNENGGGGGISVTISSATVFHLNSAGDPTTGFFMVTQL